MTNLNEISRKHSENIANEQSCDSNDEEELHEESNDKTISNNEEDTFHGRSKNK